MHFYKKISILSVLYIAQGIAPGFSLIALPVLLRSIGLSLESIGITGLLTWPWSVKFLWGPLTDKKSNNNFGRRKSWIIPLQIVLIFSLLALSLFSFDKQIKTVLIVVCFMNLISSILDVVTDAFATELLLKKERGKGNSAQIGGFYIGSIIGGGGFLIFYPKIGWDISFLLLSIIVIIAISTLFFVEERGLNIGDKNNTSTFKHFFIRKESYLILLLIVFLDFGENFGISMISPFFVDMKLTQVKIGWIIGTIGTSAALLGAIIGGILVDKIEHSRPLILFSFFQTFALILFALLAFLNKVDVVIASIVVCLEYFMANIFNVALYAWMMDKVSLRQTATDFSIMACAHNVTLLVASPLAGFSAGNLGYKVHFILAIVISVTGIVLARKLLQSKLL